MTLAADILACAGLATCSYTDIESGKIPNKVILILTVISAPVFGARFLLRFFMAVIFAAILYCLNPLSVSPLSGGDLKLMSLVYGWYGLESGLLMLLAAFALAGARGIYLITRGKMKVGDGMQLAPYMALGFLLCKIYELMSTA